ncbi:winged helix-turn-helix transcriptional regulator [Rubellimicrobium aerolatum]|uniref:Winged helix-turn-helix transcriptional regulator n=1 Tax=Rubellimicrobium aerolatum TaxID=490979 RepID=A0ABW0SFN9_9RHOB|nr:helix-turn-helix domain-containing protein [Rubellimicrobium aerolatum]MBP1807194.1 DNA-binding HxlR family transcriptional regulator [Rubellimicrobium aerolatum]
MARLAAAAKKAPSGHQVTPATPPWDVYSAACPTRLVLDRLADKWALLILGRLAGGPIRFNQLRRQIEGVSQKVLSQTLKRLERDGLLSRRVVPTVPVTVEYAITPLGRTLSDTVRALARWAEANIESVLAAQAAYDAAQTSRATT